MTMREAFAHVLKVLREEPCLRFIKPQDVIVGDRKHGDDLTKYQVSVRPASEEEPRGTRTFSSAGVKYVPSAPLRRGQKLVRYRIYLDIYCRETEPDRRILGTANAPGCLEVVERIKDAFERDWRFKKSIIALEFESVQYVETWPPPKVEMAIIIEEVISEERRAADLNAPIVGEDAKEQSP